MRNAIRDNLSSIIPVYQPDTITAETTKPYAVLVSSEGSRDNVFVRAFNASFTLWVYVAPVNYTALDTIINSILASLLKTVLTTSGGKNFELKYINKGTEFYDSDFDAYGADLLFSTLERID